MADPRFYNNVGPLAVQDFLDSCGLSFAGDSAALIHDVAAPGVARVHDLIFVENPKNLLAAQQSAAGFILCKPDMAKDFAGRVVIVSPTPQLHFVMAMQLLYPSGQQPGFSDAHPISPHAKIDPAAIIHHGAVIAANAEIGAGTTVGPYAVIGPGVQMGRNCIIGAHATITHSILGDGVAVLPGARIGQDGFGFVTHAGQHIRMPQLGRVLIGAGTEIGANATVDRGALADTVIGNNVIIDNLVMVGHNVQIGNGAILVSQSGVAGSSQIGQYAILAAQAGVADHLVVGDGAQIGAQSGIMRDVEPGARMMGSPAQPAREFFRQHSQLAKSGKSGKT